MGCSNLPSCQGFTQQAAAKSYHIKATKLKIFMTVNISLKTCKLWGPDTHPKEGGPPAACNQPFMTPLQFGTLLIMCYTGAYSHKTETLSTVGYYEQDRHNLLALIMKCGRAKVSLRRFCIDCSVIYFASLLPTKFFQPIACFLVVHKQ